MAPIDDTESLIAQLQDPSRSNKAVLALMWKGRSSVPALAQFLRTSRPSTVPDARRLAVEALNVLAGPEALDALIEIATERLAEIPDPAVRLAEEIVCSRAACALADFPDSRARETLLRLLNGKPLIGVAEAFEKLRDMRAIPRLVRWLEDDFVADPARRAILAVGRPAVPALLESLRIKESLYGAETGMSQRRHVRCLDILAELAEPEEMTLVEDALRDLAEAVRWYAARALIRRGSGPQKKRAFQVALKLLDSFDSYVREDCEEFLTSHFDIGPELVEEEIRMRRADGETEQGYLSRESTLAILLRIYRKGGSSRRADR